MSPRRTRRTRHQKVLPRPEGNPEAGGRREEGERWRTLRVRIRFVALREPHQPDDGSLTHSFVSILVHAWARLMNALTPSSRVVF